MDILFVSPWFPYPANNGARVRSSKLLAALQAAGHRCHLFSFEPAPATGKAYPQLASIAIADGWRARLPGRFGYALALLAPKPRYFRAIYDPKLFEQIRRTAERRRVQVVIGYELAAGDYIARLDDRRYVKILDGCEPFAFRSAGRTMRSRARIWKLKRFLHSMLDHVDAYIAVSDAELAWIRREIEPRHGFGAIIPNGADLAEPYSGPVDRRRVIYNGSLTYAANLETVEYFLEAIWPAIRRELPSATFVITGQPPDAATARRLTSVPGVTLAGLVEDYPRFVSSSGVLAVPLLRGGGTRIKVLEALALGCPVVATSKAVEGLNVSPGRDVLVAGNPLAFADAVVRVMSSDQLRRRLIENGRATAAQYSWEQAQARFVQLVEGCAEQHAFLMPA